MKAHSDDRRNNARVQLIELALEGQPYLGGINVTENNGRVVVTVPTEKTPWGVPLKAYVETTLQAALQCPRTDDRIFGTSLTVHPKRGKPFAVVVMEKSSGLRVPTSPLHREGQGGGYSTKPIDLSRPTPGAGVYRTQSEDQESGPRAVTPATKYHVAEVEKYLKDSDRENVSVNLSPQHPGYVVVTAKNDRERAELGVLFAIIFSDSPEGDRNVHVFRSDKGGLIQTKLVVADKEGK